MIRPTDGGGLPQDAPVFVISVAAQLAGMHPQTLRQYDRLGLLEASRTPGGGRRYSLRDVSRLREIQRLSQEEGVNLAGVRRILELEESVRELHDLIAQLRAALAEQVGLAAEREARAAEREARVHASYRRDLVPIPMTAGDVVLYRRTGLR